MSQLQLVELQLGPEVHCVYTRLLVILAGLRLLVTVDWYVLTVVCRLVMVVVAVATELLLGNGST